MKNIKFEELYELFVQEKKDNLEIVKQAIKNNQLQNAEVLKTLDKVCFTVHTVKTDRLGHSSRELKTITEELKDLEEQHLEEESYGFTSFGRYENVDHWGSDDNPEVGRIDVYFTVSSISAKEDYKELVDLTDRYVKSTFKAFVAYYTSHTKSKWATSSVDCGVLEMYRKGDLDLKALAALTHGSC
jgi:hypothetical protein